jgi:hypothetical protein
MQSNITLDLTSKIMLLVIVTADRTSDITTITSSLEGGLLSSDSPTECLYGFLISDLSDYVSSIIPPI